MRRFFESTEHDTALLERYLAFATEVLTAGVDVPTTQRLLGHVKAGTTAGYLNSRVLRRPGLRCRVEVTGLSA